jgi:hypothetical protein
LIKNIEKFDILDYENINKYLKKIVEQKEKEEKMKVCKEKIMMTKNNKTVEDDEYKKMGLSHLNTTELSLKEINEIIFSII